MAPWLACAKITMGKIPVTLQGLPLKATFMRVEPRGRVVLRAGAVSGAVCDAWTEVRSGEI